MATVSDIFAQMKNHFDADKAAGEQHVFQFAIADSDFWYVAINDGQCDIAEGKHDDPSVTLNMDADTLGELISGQLEGMQAFMQGKLSLEGDMMLATRLTEFFPQD